MYLTIVDTTQIQNYVFGSNRLRENIGASHLVAQATGRWALRCLPKPNNVQDARTGKLDATKRIEDTASALKSEVVYTGGGNAVILFADEGDAKKFERRLSLKALKEAPDLLLVISSVEFDWEGEALPNVVNRAFRDLAQKKQMRPLAAPTLGLAVTVPCRSTGLPAVGLTRKINNDPDSEYPASSEILRKRRAVRAANKRLKMMLPLPSDYEYREDFDDLGRSKGDFSYIAVVHADGNGMGKAIQDIGKKYNSNTDGATKREYIAALSRFSEHVNKAAQEALQDTLEGLTDHLDRKRQQEAEANPDAPAKPKPEPLPFRPLVFGGDDVTFVCDGRLGLSLAITYLKAFQERTKPSAEQENQTALGPFTACAGIAVVKSHYPFARAYGLAEDLCREAKEFRSKEGLNTSCLDWHFATGGLSGSIETIRKREYTIFHPKSEGDYDDAEPLSLTMRPVMLGDEKTGSLHRWSLIETGVKAFQEKTKEKQTSDEQAEKREGGEGGVQDRPGWADQRNKVKELRDALREGEEAVKRFCIHYTRRSETDAPDDVLPRLDKGTFLGLQQTGWYDGVCGYFDAIELADWYEDIAPASRSDADSQDTADTGDAPRAAAADSEAAVTSDASAQETAP